MTKILIMMIIGIFIANTALTQNMKHPEIAALNSPTFLEKFDNIIQNDKIEVSIVDSNNINESTTSISNNFVYNPNEYYNPIFRTNVICSKFIPETLKLDFVKDALNDKEKGIFKNGLTCPCLKSQPKLSELFCNYYRNISETSNDKSDKFKFLTFVVRNELPNDIEEINKYFDSRETLQNFHRHETDFPINLIKKGKIEESLALVRMFVNDQAKGKIKSIHDGSHSEKKNLFALLYFKGDDKTKIQTLDLAFEYYKNINRGYTYSLNKFLKYIAPIRYQQSVEFWLHKLEISDSSVRANNVEYCSLLRSDGTIVAEKEGISYWYKFLESEPRWKNANDDFDGAMLPVAFACMKGIVSEKEKTSVIEHILHHNKYFKPDEKHQASHFFEQFLEILYIAYPKITNDEIESFIPQRYKKYGSWIYTWELVINKGKDQQLISLEDKLSIFNKHGYKIKSEIDEYDKFIHDTGLGNDIMTLINETGNTVSFGSEGGEFPLSYEKLFKTQFLPVLINNGINNIGISEIQKVMEGYCIHDIQIHTSEKLYKTNFTVESDWYDIRPLVKSLNLALKDLNSNLRFIYLGIDQTNAWLGLLDPNQFFPLAEEIKLHCFAINYEDGMMKSDNPK